MKGVSLLRFFAGGDRRFVMRPVAPRPGVQAAVRHLRHLHREQVVARVDSRTAVDNGALAGAEPGEAITQVAGRFETAVGTEVLHPRRTQSARDMTGFRVDGLLLAAVPLPDSRIQQGDVLEQPHRLEVEDAGAVWRLGAKRATGDRRDASLERFAPRLNAAVEHRLCAVSEPAQEKPQPRRDRTPGVVVHNHPGGIVKSGFLHLVLDLPGRGQRMPAPAASAGHRLEVDERGAGNVAAQVLIFAAAIEEVPAKVDHGHVRVGDMFPQPVGADEWPEAHPCTTFVSWQKWTSCGWISCSLWSEFDQASRSEYCPSQSVRSASSTSR